LHHGHRLEHVDVLRVLDIFNQVIHLKLGDTTLVKEILTLEQVKAHRGTLLEEALFLVHEVLWNHADLLALGAHGELLLNLTSLLLRPWMWVDTLLAHPVEQLAWHLHQRLLRQEVRVVLEVIERHELHNIRSHVLAVGLRVEGLIVAVKRLHRFKVCIADTDDDNGHGEL